MLTTRYLLREILTNFLAVVFLTLFLLYITRMANFGPDLFALQATARDFALFSLDLTVFLLPFALPLAALLGVLLAFMRLAHDQELLAFSALGVSPWRLYRPVAWFALGIFILTLILNIFLLPRAKRGMRDLLYFLSARRIERGLPERTPVDWFPGLVFYAERVRKKFRFREVYILDETRPGKRGFLYARKGELLLRDREAELILKQGEGHYFSRDFREAENFYFGEYRYRLPLNLAGERELKRGEMGLSALLARARDRRLPPHKRRKYLTEFYQRFFYPLSALVLPFLGLPLGARLKSSGRGLALAAGLGLYLCYYLLFSLGTGFSESGYLPSPVALGLPSILMGAVAVLAGWDFLRREGR